MVFKNISLCSRVEYGNWLFFLEISSSKKRISLFSGIRARHLDNEAWDDES